MSEVIEIIKAAMRDLKREGLNPDILLAGEEFIKYLGNQLKACNLKVYLIQELGLDAVVADSNYLGLFKKASKRISVEPLLDEKKAWEEIQKLKV